MAKILYPRDWKKQTINGRIRYAKDTPRGFEISFNEFYVKGYREAVKDIKKLNK